MRSGPIILVAFIVGALTCLAQDAQPLGDVARQARQQKQQQDAQAQSASDPAAKPARKVVTNEEIPEHVASTSTSNSSSANPPAYPQSRGKLPAETWKAMIRAQKNAIAAIQQQIARLDSSIRFAPGPCLTYDCLQRNDRQRGKQTQEEVMKSQLQQMQNKLEEMQEAARKQGYGNGVYDP